MKFNLCYMYRILNSIGAYVLLKFIWNYIKSIIESTDTKLLSDEAYIKLQDRRNLKILDREVEHYKKTGEWRKFDLF